MTKAVLVGGSMHETAIETVGGIETIKAGHELYHRKPQYDFIYKPEDALVYAIDGIDLYRICYRIDLLELERAAGRVEALIEEAKYRIRRGAVAEAVKGNPPISRGVWTDRKLLDQNTRQIEFAYLVDRRYRTVFNVEWAKEVGYVDKLRELEE